MTMIVRDFCGCYDSHISSAVSSTNKLLSYIHYFWKATTIENIPVRVTRIVLVLPYCGNGRGGEGSVYVRILMEKNAGKTCLDI